MDSICEACLSTDHLLDAWHLECRQVLTAHYKSGNAIGGCPTLAINSGLVTEKYNDVLMETLSFDEDELVRLFRRTFPPRTIMDKFRMF